MLDDIFTSQTSVTLTPILAFEVLGIALLLGIIVSVTYMISGSKNGYSQNFMLTLVVFPAIISMIILLVGNNIVGAFSLAGAFSLIRFRSAPGNPKDVAYVFLTLAAGFAAGLGFFVYSIAFTLIICVVMFLLTKAGFAQGKESNKKLRIKIPEDLNYTNALTEIFNKYMKYYRLTKTKTADLGSVYELSYIVEFKIGADEKAFIDDLRCRNGNLPIVLTENDDNVNFPV